MLQAYFDESGEHDKETGRLTCLTLAGGIAPVSAWKILASEWRVTLYRYGLSSFHMVDFEAHKGQFEKLEDKNRKILLNELIDIIMKYVTGLYGFWCVPPPEKNAILTEAYETVFSTMCRHMAIRTVDCESQIIVVIAEHDNVSAVKTGSYLDIWKKQFMGIEFGGFARPDSCCPLQVADIVAYEISRHFRERRPERDRYPLTRLSTKMQPVTLKLIDCGHLGLAGAWRRRG
jgi:hypothetical protein